MIVIKSHKQKEGEESMTNAKELEIQLIRKNVSKKALAQALGISEMALFNKLNGASEFKASEIDKATNFLCLTRDERDVIFFAS